MHGVPRGFSTVKDLCAPPKSPLPLKQLPTWEDLPIPQPGRLVGGVLDETGGPGWSPAAMSSSAAVLGPIA